MVVAEPMGLDKALHVALSAGLVVILAGRLGRCRAAAMVLVVGVVLELLHGTMGTLGVDLPSPLGGTAEAADVAADLAGVGIGLFTLAWLDRRAGSTVGDGEGRALGGRSATRSSG